MLGFCFRLAVVGVAGYAFLPVIQNIAATDLAGAVAASLGATVAAFCYVRA